MYSFLNTEYIAVVRRPGRTDLVYKHTIIIQTCCETLKQAKLAWIQTRKCKVLTVVRMEQVGSDIFVIIPAKPLDQSKTRLAAVLPLNERIKLTRYLLRRTLFLTRQVGEVVVISRDTAVRRLAKQSGAWALIEAGSDLNAAVRQASTWVMARRGQAILIVPGDLPRLEVSDLREIIRLGQQTPSLVIAPCHRLDGTNALLLRPPGLIEFAFGPGSFARHQQAAWAVGVKPIIYHSPTVALDLDTPEDLMTWRNFSLENSR